MLVAVVASLAIGTGCASIAKAAFKQPVVTLKDVKLVGFGMTGGTFDVVLNVYNPNEFRLDASKLNYEVLADSVIVGRGTIEDQRTVQAGDSTQITLPVNFTYTGLGAVANQLRNSGLVNYRVRGAITVATTVGNFDVPYDQTGRFSLIGRDDQ
jgi:LEA14-like dessication related protein